MQNRSYRAARHEARHSLLAYQLGYQVESCSLGTNPETVILFRMSKGSLRRHWRADPLGTSFEIENIIAIGEANGRETSPQDREAIQSWAFYFPGTRAEWKRIEGNAGELVLDWSALASTERSIAVFTRGLFAAGSLEGAELAAALHVATQGPGVAPLTPLRPVVPAKAFARVPLDWRTGSFPLTLRRGYVA